MACIAAARKSLSDYVPFVFTDRHAYLQTARYSSDLADLAPLDWTILQARDFKRDPDDPGKFERYQAEALVHRNLPVSALLGIACHGPSQEECLRQELDKRGLSLKTVVKPEWYF